MFTAVLLELNDNLQFTIINFIIDIYNCLIPLFIKNDLII